MRMYSTLFFGLFFVLFCGLWLTGCIDGDGGSADTPLALDGELAALDGGPCEALDAHITPPCTEGRTCATGPFCWGGGEHYCPPAFEMVDFDDCDDGLYVGDAVSPRADPRCPAAPDAPCPDLLNLVCVYPCGEGYLAQSCDGERFVDAWRSQGCAD